MTGLLLWLALPIMLRAWTARPERLGEVSAALVFAGLGLGALWQGMATLDPLELRALGAVPNDARFIAFTAGLLVTGVGAIPHRGLVRWWHAAAAWPLVCGLLIATTPTQLPAVAAGMLVALLPIGAGRVLRRVLPVRHVEVTDVRYTTRDIGFLAAGTLLVASRGPLALIATGACVVSWTAWRMHRGANNVPRRPWLPVLFGALLLGWCWLALTVAGSPIAAARHFGNRAPVSPAAGIWLAAIALSAIVLLAGPWPLHRLVRSPLVLLAAASLAVAARLVASDGVAYWLPALTAVLVVAALVGMVRGQPVAVAAALTVVAAARPGSLAVAAAVMTAATAAADALVRAAPPVPRIARGLAACAAVGAAIVVAVVLRDEVVWGVVLTFGLATVWHTRLGAVASS